MEREKLLKYRDLAPIRFLNDFNAGLLTAEEYKLIREISKNNAWDRLDDYIEHVDQATQPVQEAQPVSVSNKEEPSLQTKQRFELRTDIKIKKNFYPVPNDVIDVLAPLQTPAEEVVYRRLIRMSYGWRRNYCRVSIPYLLKTSQIKSENTVRKALHGLIEKGHVTEYINENGRPDINNDGTLYIVFLPDDLSDSLSTKTTSTPDSENEPPSKIEPPSIFAPPSKIEGVQYLNPPTENVENTTSTTNLTIKGGANIEGGSKIEGVQYLKPTPSKIEGVQYLNPLAENVENTTSTTPSKIEGGAIFEPIKYNKKYKYKNTLSLNAIISKFYSGIGQEKVSREKRERAEKNLKELSGDGFNPEDIEFAVDWTLANAKEELYDFSIIKHTIGQAMAAKKRIEAEKAQKMEAERIAAQKEAEEAKRAKERSRIKTYKESLNADERSKLRDRANSEIRKIGQYKEEFITDYLIEAKENELISQQLGIKISES